MKNNIFTNLYTIRSLLNCIISYMFFVDYFQLKDNINKSDLFKRFFKVIINQKYTMSYSNYYYK